MAMFGNQPGVGYSSPLGSRHAGQDPFAPGGGMSGRRPPMPQQGPVGGGQGTQAPLTGIDAIIGEGGTSLGILRQALETLLSGGASPEQQNMVQQLIAHQMAPIEQRLMQQGKDMSAMLSGSAAARGLGKSSIGLGQQGLLGRSLMEQLGNAQSGLQAQGLEYLLGIPMQQAGLLTDLYGLREGSRQRSVAQADARRADRTARRFDFGKWAGDIGGNAAGSWLSRPGGGQGGT